MWLFGGWKVFRWAAPAIVFLVFMAPLPGQVQNAAGFPLQRVAAIGGGGLLQLLGQPAFVSGTTILLGENVLDVERACSGLRMFQGMLAVAVVLDQARELADGEEEGRQRAVDLYRRYLTVYDEDAEVMSELATLWVKSDRQQWPRAARLYEMAYRYDSSREADAIASLMLLTSSGDWQRLWDQSDRITGRLEGDLRRVAMRLRTQAVGQLIERTGVSGELERMFASCREAVRLDDEYFRHAYLRFAQTYPADASDERIELYERGLDRCGRATISLLFPLVETYVAAGREADAAELLEPLDEILPNLRGVARGRLTLMRGAAQAGGLSRQGRIREAAERLESTLDDEAVRSNRNGYASLYAQAHFRLGSLYRAMNRNAAAIAAFEVGGRFDPSASSWMVESARAYEASGDLSAAFDQYQQAASQIGAQQPSIYLSIARVMLAQQRRASPDQRNLEEVRSLLRVATSRGAPESEAASIIAESHVVEGDFDAAVQVVERQAEQSPDDPSPIFTGAMIRQLAGDTDAALDQIARYREAGASESEAALLQTILLARDGRVDEAEAAFDTVGDDVDANRRGSVKTQVILAKLRSGKREQASAELEAMIASHPDDVGIQRLAADVFADLGNQAAVEQAEQNLKQIEGEDGTVWREVRAIRLLRADSGEKELQEVGELFDIAMPQYVRGDRSRDALEIAERWAAEDPTPENLVRLGQTLMTIAGSGRTEDVVTGDEAVGQAVDQAEQAFTSAIRDDPENVEAWVGALQVQAGLRRDRDKAIKNLKEFSKQLDIPPLRRSFVLSQLYNAIGENARAGIEFERTLELLEDREPELRQAIRMVAARFFAQRRPERAIELCREELREFPDSELAKTYLVGLLADRNRVAELNESIELQATMMGGEPLAAQKRLRAQLLARRAELAELAEAAETAELPASASASASADGIPVAGEDAATMVTPDQPPKRDRAEALALLRSITPVQAADALNIAAILAADGKEAEALNAFRDGLRLETPTADRLAAVLEFWNRNYAAAGEYVPIADRYFADLRDAEGGPVDWLRLSLRRAAIEVEAAAEEAGGETPDPSSVESTLRQREAEIIDRFRDAFVPAEPDGRFVNAVVGLISGIAAAGRGDRIPAAIGFPRRSSNSSGPTMTPRRSPRRSRWR